MQISFCPLFSGSSGNALLVVCEGTALLVDAGVSASRVMKECAAAGVDPARLAGILITHEHSDHISGAGILSRKLDLPIYAPEKTWEAMAGKIGDVAGKNRRCVEPDADFYIGDMNIYAFRTPHDAADPVGYAFTSGHCKLTILTDIGCVESGWLRAAEGSGTVLLEANHDRDMLQAGRYPYELKRRILGRKGHLSNDDAARAAVTLVKGGVSDVILGHLSKENNFPQLAYETVASALREAGYLPGEDVNLSVARRDGRSQWHTISDWNAALPWAQAYSADNRFSL